MSQLLLSYYSRQIAECREALNRTSNTIARAKLLRLIDTYTAEVNKLDRQAQQLDQQSQPNLLRT